MTGSKHIKVLEKLKEQGFRVGELRWKVRANKVGDDDMVASQIRQMEKDVSEMDKWGHSDVDIRVVDESSDKIITG